MYSRSSAQMKNSPMGRPTSRTTFDGHQQRHKRRRPAGNTGRGEIGDVAQLQIPLDVHPAEAAVRAKAPCRRARRSPNSPRRVQQCLQRRGLGHGIVVHDPCVIAAQRHRAAQTVLKAARAAHVRAGVLIEDASVADHRPPAFPRCRRWWRCRSRQISRSRGLPKQACHALISSALRL